MMINQSIKIHSQSNNTKLQCSKCYSTREALRLLNLSEKYNTNMNISEEREETEGENNVLFLYHVRRTHLLCRNNC